MLLHVHFFSICTLSDNLNSDIWPKYGSRDKVKPHTIDEPYGYSGYLTRATSWGLFVSYTCSRRWMNAITRPMSYKNLTPVPPDSAEAGCGHLQRSVTMCPKQWLIFFTLPEKLHCVKIFPRKGIHFLTQVLHMLVLVIWCKDLTLTMGLNANK